MKRLIAAALVAGLAGPLWAAQPTPEEFVKSAAAAGSFEIQSSTLALESSQRDDVKSFADRMVSDHTAAGDKLMAAAEADGVSVSEPAIAAADQKKIDALKEDSPTAFDPDYIDMQVAAHEQAVALFQSFSGAGGELGGFAEATLPTLESHLDAAKKLQSQ